MSDGSSSPNETKQCVLKCKEAKHFFNLPNKVVLHKTWFNKLGIDAEEFYLNPWVCDRHFSHQMFTVNNKLYQHAVPDINLPKKKASQSKSTAKEGTVKSKTMGKKFGKRTDISNIEINDSSNILVDYQLRLQGKHVCDVIEIPQFVVVFTVLKAKNNTKIQLNDTKGSNQQTGGNKPPQFIEVITIDDDMDDILELEQQGVLEAESSATIQYSAPAINQLQDSAIIQSQLQESQPQLQQTESQPQLQETESQPELPQTESQPQLEQTEPQPTEPSTPEDDIVYYTAENALPRRERSVQVDLTMLKETGIQCDVELDNDIMEMAYNDKLYWVQSSSRIENLQDNNMHECLVCGEIVSNNASKVRHAHGHEATPSLCSQCGVMFANQMKLKDHIQNFHTRNWTLKKPQRCPVKKCLKAFQSKEQLTKHVEEHMQTKRYKCNKCLQYFASSLKLICHQRALDKCLRTRGWTSRRWSKRI